MTGIKQAWEKFVAWTKSLKVSEQVFLGAVGLMVLLMIFSTVYGACRPIGKV